MQAPCGPTELNPYECSQEKRCAFEMQNFVISSRPQERNMICNLATKSRG